jgi:pimeloyl-ACP methyl ester carboxylesterase
MSYAWCPTVLSGSGENDRPHSSLTESRLDREWSWPVSSGKRGVEMDAFVKNATVVLVHGAWADGSCWSNVIVPLQSQGLKVICAPIPLTSLTDDAAALSRTLERTTGSVILAGQAYGGAVVGTTREERVKALVYIAALAPDEGETVAQVFYRDASHPNAPKLSADKHGFLWMPEEGFHQAVAHKAPSEQKSILAAVQRPISVQCIQQPAPAVAWRTKPSWYLLAEEDRMINPKTQRFMADRMGASIRTERVDHSPMYTAPELVIDVILEAARRTLSRPEALAGGV